MDTRESNRIGGSGANQSMSMSSDRGKQGVCRDVSSGVPLRKNDLGWHMIGREVDGLELERGIVVRRR